MGNQPFDDIKNQSRNETDPRLRFDAFTANVKNGGLRSISSINMLVSYIVANLNHRVMPDTITLALSESMMANHFEVADAISKLLKSGTIKLDDEGALYMDNSSLAEIDLIEKDLPLTVRQTSIKACQKIIAKETFKRENITEIVEAPNGYKVLLTVSDGETEFMKLELYAVSLTQAEIMRDKFITNPVNVYETLIESIFSNE